MGCSSKTTGYLVCCDLNGSNIDYLSSSIRSESRSELDNCPAYVITDMAYAPAQECLYFVAQYQLKNSCLWQFKPEQAAFTQPILELRYASGMVRKVAMTGRQREHQNLRLRRIPDTGEWMIHHDYGILIADPALSNARLTGCFWHPIHSSSGKLPSDYCLTEILNIHKVKSFGFDIEGVALLNGHLYLAWFACGALYGPPTTAGWRVLAPGELGGGKWLRSLGDGYRPFILRRHHDKLVACSRHTVTLFSLSNSEPTSGKSTAP
jgi:hypothetical protein